MAEIHIDWEELWLEIVKEGNPQGGRALLSLLARKLEADEPLSAQMKEYFIPKLRELAKSSTKPDTAARILNLKRKAGGQLKDQRIDMEIVEAVQYERLLDPDLELEHAAENVSETFDFEAIGSKRLDTDTILKLCTQEALETAMFLIEQRQETPQG